MNDLSLTIGMAVYDDHEVAAMTLHSLLCHHADVMPRCEILVVDNHPVNDQAPEQSPSTRYSRMLGWLAAGSAEVHQQLTAQGHPPAWQPLVGKVTYLAMPEPRGTSAPRERIFTAAAAPAVMCLDAHVLIPSGVIRRLIQWYEANPETLDFFQGPMIMDNHTETQESFDDLWRGSMWGTWAGDPRVRDPRELPFAIPAMGLGLFTCRKAAWLAWPEGLQGFGGEEHNVHLLWRKHGRQTLCLPWLRWWHLFRDTTKPQPYPNVTWERIRNYVLWAKHIGMPEERELLMRAKDQFCGHMQPPIPVEDWNALIADPRNTLAPPSQPAAAGPACRPPAVPGAVPGRPLPAPPLHTIEGVYQFVRDTPRDLEQHWRKVKELAKQVAHVTAFTKRREWAPVLLAGLPETLIVHCIEPDPLTDLLHQIHERSPAPNSFARSTKTFTTTGHDSIQVREIDETDLLVLSTIHSADRVHDELSRFAGRVRRWILIQGTGAFGEQSEHNNNTPGLNHGIRRYLAEHPQWHRVWHTDVQYGMTLLSCDPNERTIDRGPGWELHQILADLGASMSVTCKCRGRAQQMDAWGPAGCREHLDEVVVWMKEAYNDLKWGERFAIAAKAATTSLVLKVNWLDPIPGLIEEAIRRAEVKDAEWAQRHPSNENSPAAAEDRDEPAALPAAAICTCAACGQSRTCAASPAACPYCGEAAF